MKPIPAAWRDTILFLAGLSLLIFEAVGRSGEPRWSLIIAYGWMMGLPVVIHRDSQPSAPPPVSSGPPSQPGEIIP